MTRAVLWSFLLRPLRAGGQRGGLEPAASVDGHLRASRAPAFPVGTGGSDCHVSRGAPGKFPRPATVSHVPRLFALPLLVTLTMLGCAVSSETRGGVLYQAAPVSGPVLPPPTEGHEASFCELNPGACLEPLPAPEPGESEATADPWKSFACIQACQAYSAGLTLVLPGLHEVAIHAREG